MTEATVSSQPIGQGGRRKWFLALAAVLLVLAAAGIGVATVLQLSSLLIFGPLLLVSSAVQLVFAFFAEKGKESLLHFIAAGLEAALAFFIMANPPERVIGLITLIGLFLIIIGLARLARSLVTQSRGRAWILVTGAVALLLGISVWRGGPAAKLGFVGLCIALDFLCQGISWSALALMERRPDPVRVFEPKKA
jgi:uncharacterized membrane protein HdeD (DUF308 family)